MVEKRTWILINGIENTESCFICGRWIGRFDGSCYVRLMENESESKRYAHTKCMRRATWNKEKK